MAIWRMRNEKITKKQLPDLNRVASYLIGTLMVNKNPLERDHRDTNDKQNAIH